MIIYIYIFLFIFCQVMAKGLFDVVINLSQTTGIPPDLIKTAISMILTLFISPIFRCIHHKNIKNIISIILGSALLAFMIQQWSIIILGGIVITYFTMKMFKNPFMVSCLISIVLLLYVHSYRLFFEVAQWKVDFSVYFMLLVTKITYYGKYIQKNQSKYNFLDYLGYNLFFPSVLVGPIFSFQLYETFLLNKYNLGIKNGRWLKAFQPLVISIIFLIIFLTISRNIPSDFVLNNEYYLNLSLPAKLISIYFIGFFYRVKYYFAWYFGQATTNLSGLSFSQNEEYDSVVAISYKFETQYNPKKRTQYWNTSMQQWLKNVVFEGLNVFGPNVAFFGTFFFSAFWHGLYLSYFYGFLLWGIMLHLTKWIYKWSFILPNNIKSSIVSKILTYVVSTVVWGYIGMFMLMIKWQEGIRFHGDMNHIITILLFIFLIISFIIKPPKRQKIKEKEK